MDLPFGHYLIGCSTFIGFGVRGWVDFAANFLVIPFKPAFASPVNCKSDDLPITDIEPQISFAKFAMIAVASFLFSGESPPVVPGKTSCSKKQASCKAKNNQLL